MNSRFNSEKPTKPMLTSIKAIIRVASKNNIKCKVNLYRKFRKPIKKESFL